MSVTDEHLGHHGPKAWDRLIPPRNSWLVFWYDGNQNRVTIVDFGTEVGFGPYGNEALVMSKLNEMEAPHSAPFDLSLHAMVQIVGDEDDIAVIMDDRDVHDIKTVTLE